MRHSIKRACAMALGLGALALGGCKGGDGSPDCKAVGAAYATMVRAEVEKEQAGQTAPAGEQADQQDPQQAPQQDQKKDKEKALSLIPLLKEAMVEKCAEEKWSGETRRCVTAARTRDDLERCRTRPEEEAAEEAPAAGDKGGAPAKAPESAPAPAKTDSP